MDFEIFRMDIFAGWKHDHVLSASDDVKKAVGIDMPQIPRAKPAILGKRFVGRRRVAIVPVENHRAANQHFTDTVLVGVEDFYLGSSHWFSNGTDPVVVFGRGGCRSAGFRQTISLQNSKSKLMKI